MIGQRPANVVARALISAIWIGAGAGHVMAQSYSINGQVGYLGEWEIKANLAQTITASGVSYDGPVTLRHVGLCSANGVEEKSGELRLAVSRWTGGIEGTLAMDGDSCRVVASPSRPYSGLLSCRDAQGVPINFSIESVGVGAARPPGAGK